MKRLKHITRFFGRVAPELGGNGLFASLDELIEQRQYVAYLRQLGQSKTFSSMAGDVKSAFKGRGMELEEIRSYTYGDDVRDIDWRVTARKEQPFTKLYAEERDREIYALLDATPVLRRPQLRFWKWIASYYLCKLGDVYKAALPSGLKLESETAVTYNEDFEADGSLRPNEQAVLDAFTGVLKLTVSELEKKTGLRNVVPVVASLMAKGAVEVSEELKRGFMPKMQTFIRLAEVYKDEEKLQAVFADFKRAKKQEHLLICFLELSHALNPALVRELSKKELLENCGCSPAILDGVLKRGAGKL